MIRWAVSRPAGIWAITCVILLGGAVSFSRLALATSGFPPFAPGLRMPGHKPEVSAPSTASSPRI